MVIYGWRSSHIKTTENKQVICPHCNNQGGLSNSVYGRYVHIFWIPTIPIGKTGGAVCSHCQKAYKPKEMSEDMKRAYKNTKQESKTPLWHFSGIAIVGLIILFFSISDKIDAQEDLTAIDSPISGDVYKYESDANRYSTLKVVEVDEDSVYFRYNNYDYTQKVGIEEIDVDTCYTQDIYMMSRDELKNMYENGTIYDVSRK